MVIALILIIVLFIMLGVTTNRLNERIKHNEEFLKTYSEDIKHMKLLLKHEVAMANSDAYPVANKHIDFVSYNNIRNNV